MRLIVGSFFKKMKVLLKVFYALYKEHQVRHDSFNFFMGELPAFHI